MIPIFPDLQSSTLLTYALQPIPTPFTASVLQGADPPLAEQDVFSLVLLITNGGSGAVTVEQIVVTVPYGPGSSELSGDATGMAGVLLGTAGFECVQHAGSPHASPPGMQFVVQPAGGAPSAALQAGASLSLVVQGIVTNPEPGVVEITVDEQVEGSVGEAWLPLPVLPLGFYFDNLVALDESTPSLPGGVVSQVAYGASVRLQWDTSVMNVTPDTFVVRYSTPAGEVVASVPVSSPDSPLVNSWVSPPLTADTVFTVVATTNLGGSIAEQSFALSTAVAVVDPDLVAGTLAVGGEAIIDTLSVTGTASVSGTADVAGLATLSGGVTVSAGAVSMLGAAQQLYPAYDYVVTYSASTDGFVLGVQLGQYTATTLYGSIGSPPTATVSRSSFLLPVRSGDTFTVQPTAMSQTFFFIPLGAPAETWGARYVSKAAPSQSTTFQQASSAPEDFVAALARVVGRPLDDGPRARLLAALRRL